MGVTQDMQEGCRQYLSDACVRVHQGALHSGEEDPQVLCKLLPGDVVQQLLQAIAHALQQIAGSVHVHITSGCRLLWLIQDSVDWRGEVPSY